MIQTQELFDKKEEKDINVQRIIRLVLSHLWWFIIAVLIALVVAFLYLRYSTPVYNVQAALLIKDEKAGNSPDAQMLSDLGLGGQSNVYNEVEIFQSRRLMEKVVTDLQLFIEYYTEGRIKTIETYTKKPFDFYFINYSSEKITSRKEYHLIIKRKNGFVFENKKHKWGDTLFLPMGKALVTPNYHEFTNAVNKEYTIHINNPEATVSKIKSNLSIALSNKSTSTIDLALESTLQDKGEAILNKLIDVYIQSNVNDKNRIADSTMKFIDERLVLVSDELTGIEKEIEDFKESSGLTDLSAQSQQLISSSSDYIKQITNQQVQLSVVQSLENHLSQNKNSTVPASMANDPTFTSLVNTYNQLQMERQRLLMSSTENNPMVENIDQRINTTRNELRNTLNTVKRGIQATITQLSQQTGHISSQMRAVPGKERIYLEKSRQQSIKQELYLFLLKKREETAIAKSSTIANAKIIDSAKSANQPFQPNTKIVYISALLLGLLVPGLGIYLKQLMNIKILSKADITDRTSIPIIGEINHEETESIVVVEEGGKSQIAEQFRSLRTNLQFMLSGEEDKIILLTSSMSGEGKSFVAINIASSLSLSGKKVVLLELDLRKPKISKNLGLDNTIGYSTYMIGQTPIEKILLPSGLQDNFYIIPSGPVPPNPAELIMKNKMKEFVKILRDNFDYILFDTPPVGLVTDAQLLAEHSDVNIYLVRQGYTFKEQINIPNDLIKEKKMKRLSIVVNDISISEGYGGYGYGGYGYGGYGYGNYGNGYFEEGKIKKKSGLDKLRNILSRK